MGDPILQKRFIGQARLVRLLLWKVGDSTDIGACLNAALIGGMIDDDDSCFLLDCMNAEEALRDGGESDFAISDEAVVRLQRCVDKLNRADCA